MKVEVRREKEFEPVVITIETKEEFDALWHITNEYIGSSFEGNAEVTDIKSLLWNKLDNIKEVI